MKLSKFNSKTIVSLWGLSLLFGGGISAYETRNNQIINNSLDTPTSPQIAELRNFCNDGESMFFWAETRDFWVNICGGDFPYYYVGVSKKNTRNSIRLELTDYDQQGTYFQAKNGKVIYEIIMNTAKGSFLLVTEGNKQLVRQPLINWE
jgi:hypothetical protein